jgi:hypothetical protein
VIKAVKPEKEECLGIGGQESRKREDLSGGSRRRGSRWCEVVVMDESKGAVSTSASRDTIANLGLVYLYGPSVSTLYLIR